MNATKNNKPYEKPSILIFDSGVGGLSIFDHINEVLPDAEYIYVQDSDWAPYGDRGDSELADRIHLIFKKFLAMKPDIIIIACNTASTFILPSLRAKTTIPIIGVIPPIKPAAMHSKTKVIGLLATPATIGRTYTCELIRDFASHCKTIRHGSTALVEISEAKLRGEPIDIELLRQEIKPIFVDQQLDIVLLGCTHFPHIKEELQQAAPWKVQWIDSGAAIARRLMAILSDIQIESPRSSRRILFDTKYRAPSLAFRLRDFRHKKLDKI